MERAGCDGRMPGRGLGLAPVGQRIFRTVRRGGFPKLRSKSSVSRELPWYAGCPVPDWSHLKMAETAAGQHTHTLGNNPQPPLLWDSPREARSCSPPCLIPCAKNWCLCLGPFCRRPGGWEAADKPPFSAQGGVVGPPTPGSRRDRGSCTLTAAPAERPAALPGGQMERWGFPPRGPQVGRPGDLPTR